jgi:hypothetical protein
MQSELFKNIHYYFDFKKGTKDADSIIIVCEK